MNKKLSSIAFVVPYFGKLPDTMDMWLYSCRRNPTVDWLLFTDDQGVHDYPENVHVTYMSFEEFVQKLQRLYHFPLGIHSPRKICDFRPAFGEVLEKELQDFDFWGHCDLDIIWGDIRLFYTEDVLSQYDKIGFTGNCAIYRNIKSVNRAYRGFNHRGEILYKTYFSDNALYCFDEVGINDIFLQLGFPFYKKVFFSNLDPHRHNFYMSFMPKQEHYKNKRVIYMWDNGHLFHVCEYRKKVIQKEIMFLHFLESRKMDIHIDSRAEKFLIVPNQFLPYEEVSAEYIRKKSKPYWIKFILREMRMRKGLRSKLRKLYGLASHNYWTCFHGEIFNYWTWTNYDKDKKDRIYFLDGEEQDDSHGILRNG